MERRAYIRQPLRLNAHVIAAAGRAHSGVIGDFCLGGMFVECDGLKARPAGPGQEAIAQGDTISVVFSADLRGSSREFRVGARVAGVFGRGLGLEFVEPDPQALLVLQDIATRTRHAAPRTAPPSGAGVSNAPKLLILCRDSVERFLRPRVRALFKQAGDALFLSARDAGSDVDQAKYYDAIKEAETMRQPVEAAFLEMTLNGLEQLGQPSAGRKPDENTGLSLVDSQEFTDLLTVKRILEKAEPLHKEQLFDLDARFSKLAGVVIDKQNNPVGVVGLCSAFHDAVQHLGASRTARMAVFDAFEHKLIDSLSSLYKELNDLLIENGVLPTVERPKPAVPHHRPPPPRAPAPAAPPSAESSGGWPAPPSSPDASGGWPAPPPSPAATGGWSAPPAVQAPAPPPPDSASAAAYQGAVSQGPPRYAPPPAGAGAPAYGPGPYAVPPTGPAPPPGQPGAYPGEAGASAQTGAPAPRNALRTVRSLLGLQRQLAPGAPAGAPAPVTATGIYNTREVIDALNAVQQEMGPGAGGDTPQTGLKSRILTALAARGEDAHAKHLGGPEDDAIEVIAGLVDSILRDVLVSDGVKPRMRRLEVPLVKVAMQDEAFLSNETHPARQVVNQLGQLHLPVAPEPGSQDEAYGQQVDQLVDRVVNRFDRDAGVFAEVREELDSLVARQSEAYLERVQAVVKACEQQQNTVRGMRRDHSGAAAARAVPEALQPWMNQVRRLAVGDVVGMEKGGSVRRETLAWVGEDQGDYVFVDAKGERASSMIPQELAVSLQRGKAKVLEESNLTPMERGLYQVFQEMYGRLAHEATHDKLSGLYNEKQFLEHLELTLGRARREHSSHVLCYLDLDDFTGINRICGRKAADVLLERLARVLEKHVGDAGFAARLEGDRFAMVLEECGEDEGFRIADKYRHSIDQSSIVWKGETLPISVSVGLVTLTEHAEDVASVLEAARGACGRAKQAGRNRTEIFRLEAPAPAVEGSDPGAMVARALDQGRLKLRCQRVTPILQGEGAKPHYEILLGIEDEQGELQPPTDFVHAAERSEQMGRIDRWVIDAAFAWMARNKRYLAKVSGFAINLSGLSLSDSTLMDYVLGKFTESKVPPGKVLFEVTETAGIERLSVAGDFIRLLKEYGVRFSLDDFGTGHSSYSYLKQLPVDYVKIDGMFVKDIVNQENDLAVVKSITEIAHYMGKRVIAEYVETEAILDLLREIGVDYAQGYVLHAPVLLEDLA